MSPPAWQASIRNPAPIYPQRFQNIPRVVRKERRYMKFGLPYQGSKSKIAPWVIDHLPKADCFVDLMAGGCAVTHAAMVSGKYKRFIANDIEGIPEIFKNAIEGKYRDFRTVPTREEFFDTDDKLVKLLYSFGNDRKSYLWGPKNEKIKVIASRMLTAKTLHERRMYYR